MRFSTSAIFAAVAIGASAFPQDVHPISQISDGQIQAPPATAPAVPATSAYEVPSPPAATEVLPSVTPVPLPSPIVPVPSAGVSSAPYPISSAVYGNSTVAPTGGAPATSSPAGESTGSPQPTEGAGSAASTVFVSMGALFAGLFAFLA